MGEKQRKTVSKKTILSISLKFVQVTDQNQMPHPSLSIKENS